MKNEIRSFDLDKLAEISSQYTTVRFGTEGCVNKFCKSMEELLTTDLKLKDIHIVTPRIPDKYMEKTVRYIEEVKEKYGIESIVINDYGLLYKLKGIGMKFNEVIIGRTLIRSLAYVPWGNFIIRDENDSMKENLLMANIFHKSKIEFFKEYDVTGVELCQSPLLKETIEILHENNMKAYVYHNTVIATIGRTCPIVRMKKTTAVDCEHLCDTCYKVELDKVWGVNKFMYQDPSQEVRDLVPDYMLKENVVYYITKSPVAEDTADYIIFDYKLNKEA